MTMGAGVDMAAERDPLCVECEKTNSVGTCGLCGYYGAGPRHDCQKNAYRCAKHQKPKTAERVAP